MRTRTYRNLVGLGGGFGLIAAVYTALELYDASLSQICSVNSYVSCGKVAASGMTTTFGISDSTWGIAGFVVILVFAVLTERNRQSAMLAYLLCLITTAGVGLALYFLYVEVVLIHALCPVCVTAYLFGGVAWLGSLGLARRAYRKQHPAPAPAAADA